MEAFDLEWSKVTTWVKAKGNFTNETVEMELF